MAKKGKIAVLGGGESGTGTAVLAKKQGFEVFLSDNNPIKDKYKSVLKKFDIDFEEGGHTENRILDAGEVMKSPGIPENVPIVRKVRKAGIPVISEIEFAGRYTNARRVCITGSNGKTTTTLLTYHILKKGGLNVGLAGNVGKSFAWQVALHHFDYYVLEISSFQLDGMYNFKADIAILLNITPDHLDRYDYSFEKYTDSKFRIIQNQTPEDYFIYVADDPVTAREVARREIIAQKVPVSFRKPEKGPGAWVENNRIVINNGINEFNMTLEELALQGKHNVYNSMAAAVAGRLMEIRKNTVRQSLSDFQNIAHRMEYVASVHGIVFINDSKATNVNSTWYALSYYNKPIVWIAGGVDKGNDYSVLQPLVREKVKAIICLGLDNTNLHKAFEGLVDFMVDVESVEEAVSEAYYAAKKGDTVLLSPSCSSFDLFADYEERGELFKQAVKML